jgi:hypothetical protein
LNTPINENTKFKTAEKSSFESKLSASGARLSAMKMKFDVSQPDVGNASTIAPAAEPVVSLHHQNYNKLNQLESENNNLQRQLDRVNDRNRNLSDKVRRRFCAHYILINEMYHRFPL